MPRTIAPTTKPKRKIKLTCRVCALFKQTGVPCKGGHPTPDINMEACKELEIKKYFGCEQLAQHVPILACAYRHYNDVFKQCENCKQGKNLLRYFRRQGIPILTQEQVQEKIDAKNAPT